MTVSGMTLFQSPTGSSDVNATDLSMERFPMISHRSCASVAVNFRMPISSKMISSNFASLAPERGTHSELGGLDASFGLALLAVIGLGLQQYVDKLAVADFVAGRIEESLIQSGQHAECRHQHFMSTNFRPCPRPPL